jgi:uncharacterized protein YwqG
LNSSQSLTVSHWLARLVGVAGAIVFTFFGILGIVSNSPCAVILFIPLTLASIALALLYGRTTIGQQGILHSAPLGCYALEWGEIRAVVIDTGGNTVVFKGEGKQLVLPGFAFWAGRDKPAAMALLGEELKQRGIEVSRGFAAFAISRHCRVKGPLGQGKDASADQVVPLPGPGALSKENAAAPADQGGIAQHLEYLNSLRKPALGLRKSAGKRFSKIGGLPNLPGDLPWPEWKERPLAFLCQVELSGLPPGTPFPGLPPSGCLYFFYDQQESRWGFDPNDKGSWRVLYTPGDMQDRPEREAPEALDADNIYGEKPVALSPIQTYPDWQDERVDGLQLTSKQRDEYIALCASVFENQPAHHLLGYPSPVQSNDMDLECQLVSNGLYCGDPSGHENPRAKELAAGRSDWILLLQLDTDDETGMMWGDSGMLYFWIKQDDLAARRFDNCWMILQCC